MIIKTNVEIDTDDFDPVMERELFEYLFAYQNTETIVELCMKCYSPAGVRELAMKLNIKVNGG